MSVLRVSPVTALAALLTLMIVLSSARPVNSDPARCKVPLAMTRLQVPLPAVERALRTADPLIIVALGSSTTSGEGASSPQNRYPNRLEMELRQRFQGEAFRVINAGIGGQLARDMLARMDRQVIANKPALVIWQTGMNDALAGVDLVAFKSTLREGISRLRQKGIDVLLLDQQYYPGVSGIANFQAYVQAISDIARDMGVSVVHRHDIMRYLAGQTQSAARDLLAPDAFHMNDAGYRCLGLVIADGIAERISKDAAN